MLGTVNVLANYESQEATLPMLVVKGEGPNLLGRNGMSTLRLNWHKIFWLHNASLNEVLGKYKAVYEPGLGTVTGFKANDNSCSRCPSEVL